MNTLESQESFWNLGTGSRQEKFWKVIESSNGQGFPHAYITFYVNLSFDTITENRRIYGVFDLLADIGGLLDSLQILSRNLFVLITWLFGSEFQFLLISRIFKLQSK